MRPIFGRRFFRYQGEEDGGDAGGGGGGNAPPGIGSGGDDNSPQDASSKGDAGDQGGSKPDAAGGNDEQPWAGLVGAPEGDYEFKIPDGTVVDEGMMGAVQKWMRENNISSEFADKLVGFYGELMGMVDAQVAGQREDFKSSHAKARQDHEKFGGDNGAHATEFVAMVDREFLDDPTRALLKETGLGEHSGLWAAFAGIGERLYTLTDTGNQQAKTITELKSELAKYAAEDDSKGGDPRHTDPEKVGTLKQWYPQHGGNGAPSGTA